MTRQKRFGEAGLTRIGNHIRQVREKAGLSQTDVARKADISTRTFRDLEAGRTNPSLATMVAVIGTLGVKLDDLIELAQSEQPSPDVTPADTILPGKNVLTRTLDEPRMRGCIFEFDKDERSFEVTGSRAVFAYVLDGDVTVTLDGEEVQLRRGDSVHARAAVASGWRACAARTRLLLVESEERG